MGGSNVFGHVHVHGNHELNFGFSLGISSLVEPELVLFGKVQV